MKKVLICIWLAVSLFTACNNNENNPDDSTLSIRLTDAPGDYQEVLIDVQKLLIKASDDNNDESGWQEIPLETYGQLDLLKLTNGKDTLLAEIDLPPGKISQMRMVLGDNNQIMINSIYHDLSTPSAQQSGLKFNIHATLEAGVTYRMWIDFDATRSVVKKGNGTYSLKPTIKVFTEANSGSIKGIVTPVESKPLVSAISIALDTFNTYANETTGEFLIPGLEEGIYKVVFTPVSGYVEKDTTGVSVTNGVVTELKTIELDKETP